METTGTSSRRVATVPNLFRVSQFLASAKCGHGLQLGSASNHITEPSQVRGKNEPSGNTRSGTPPPKWGSILYEVEKK